MEVKPIDVGTDSCEVAYINKDGVVEVIPRPDADLKTANVVSVAGGKPLVGEAARRQAKKKGE